jgi:hypothetical protein
MDLQELARRTRIPIRRLRHCLDQGLVPGLRIEIADNEVGRPRKFHDDVGFAISCAATLITAGIARSTVRVFMGGMAKLTFPDAEKLVLLAFFERQASGTAELGDNVNMRMQLEALGAAYDTGWVHPGNPAQLAATYQPLTRIVLDIGQVGAQVFGWQR